jgi:TusA-related sulfurtransferase
MLSHLIFDGRRQSCVECVSHRIPWRRKNCKKRRIVDHISGGLQMADLDFNVDDTVDITDVNCPVTFVKTKVALEELDDGQILQVHLNDGEPVQNVPRSIREEGHEVLRLDDNGDGTYELYIKKVGD